MAAGMAVTTNRPVPIHDATTMRAASGASGRGGSTLGGRAGRASSSSSCASLWYATDQASHGGDRLGQSPGQGVVGEQLDRPLPARRAPASGVDPGDRPAPPERRSPPPPSGAGPRPYPVTPSTTASCDPPLSPASCGHPGGGRLEEHDAEALLLQPEPPVAAHHGEHVDAAVDVRPGRSSGTRPRKRTGAPGGRPGARAGPGRGPIRRSTSWRDGRREASPATARIRTSKPLRGTSRLSPSTTRASAPSAEARPGGGALVRRERAEAARRRRRAGTTTVGSGPAARPLRLGRRVAAGRHHELGAPQHRPSRARLPGRRPGMVTSAPCSTTP